MVHVCLDSKPPWIIIYHQWTSHSSVNVPKTTMDNVVERSLQKSFALLFSIDSTHVVAWYVRDVNMGQYHVCQCILWTLAFMRPGFPGVLSQCHCFWYPGDKLIRGIGSDGVNSLKPRRNRHRLTHDSLKCIFLNENGWISISLTFFPNARINNIVALVQITAWRRPLFSQYKNESDENLHLFYHKNILHRKRWYTVSYRRKYAIIKNS